MHKLECVMILCVKCLNFLFQAKEQELEAIDKLLVDGMGADTLKRYQDHFLLSASMRSLPTQSDSDEESS